MSLDHDGQPESAGVNWDRVRDRAFDELVGLCRGVLADGALNLAEVQFLGDWIKRNPHVVLTYLGQKLQRAIEQVLADGRLDHEEEDLLVDLLMQAVGGTLPSTGEASHSSTLPLDDPAPSLVFPGAGFCFTGKFTYGTRRDCESAVVARGGEIHKHPKSATRFLIVGDLGSRDWAHSTSGRKIEHALILKQDGKTIAIVCEAHWIAAVGSDR